MAAPGLDFLDQKVVKAPVPYNGDRSRWKHFNVKLKGFVNGLGPPLKEMMEAVVAMKAEVNHTFLRMSPEQIALDAKLYVT